MRGTNTQTAEGEASRTTPAAAAGSSRTTRETTSTAPQQGTATMQLNERRGGEGEEEEDVVEGKEVPVVQSGDTGAVLEVLRVDRRVVGGSGDGSLPALLCEEAEGDLHEKPDWVDRDVEALR